MMMQPCANSGAVKDGPCMMGGSPTTNPMMHHSPGDVSQPSLTGIIFLTILVILLIL